jgi:hypothetical protein
LSLESSLNANERRCYWETSTETTNSSNGGGSCHFRDIGEDMTRMFIVAVISSVVSAPLAMSIHHLIVNVLSKETLDRKTELEKQAKKTQRERSNRRILGANSTPSDMEGCGRTLQEDLNSLLKELSSYYQHLLREDNTKAKKFESKIDQTISSPSLTHRTLLVVL